MNAFRWTENSIRLFRAAQEATGFSKAIAEKLLPYLNAEDTVLDAGCGLGGLSLALAPHVGHVFALDTDAAALNELKKDILQQNVPNITALCEDVFSFTPPVQPDVLVCCSFGQTEEVPQLAKRLGVRTVLWIKKDYADHRFSKGKHPINGEGYGKCAENLTLKGIPFTAERFCVEAGQPLHDLDEARLFFSEYGRDGDVSVYTDDFLKSRLVPSRDPRYAWYLPHERKLALIVFHGETLPE